MRRRFKRWLAIGVAGTLGFLAPGISSIAQEPILLDTPVSQTRSAGAEFQPAFSGCNVQIFSPVNPDFEQQVVELVNAHRASIGRPPLKRVDLLDQTARYHARDMREDDYFNHSTYDRVGGSLQFVCDFGARVGGHYPQWNRIGENIAAGYATPQAVMNAWLNSTGHRANIENTDYREIGVGYDALGGAYGRYWVQNFGRRTNAYPLVINDEYSRTASSNVSVYIYGAWTQVRLRNDGGTWSAWQPFSNSFNWTLNADQGVREVCAEFTNGSQTFSACDTIFLVATSAPKLAIAPATLSFVYDLSTAQVHPQPPASVQLSNTGNANALNWTAGADQPWINVSPASGSTPGTAQVNLMQPALPGAVGTYPGIISFNTASNSASLTVTLSVVSGLPFKTWMPIAQRQ